MAIKDPGFLYATMPMALLSTTEYGLGIVAANLATLRPLIKQISQKLGPSWERTRTRTLKSLRIPATSSDELESQTKTCRVANSIRRAARSGRMTKNERKEHCFEDSRPMCIDDEDNDDTFEGHSATCKRESKSWRVSAKRVSDEENQAGISPAHSAPFTPPLIDRAHLKL